ncbi:blast:Pyridoxine/pyridoxamine 5'-phosphate oxidase [Drosophila guanche]|uniref:pyridoxal 5'-phosphate synthase n=2 Tax=Drosophila guanche TaxID=7266 RepID=A0A3B0KG94_DROGU|nr:blast:Pyridoxine/pyridoxamine 5'-phosphate oxidase [Drosophila guanche]
MSFRFTSFRKLIIKIPIMTSVVLPKLWESLSSGPLLCSLRQGSLSSGLRRASTLPREERKTIEEPYRIFLQWLAAVQHQVPQLRPRLACMATVDKAGEPVTRLTKIDAVNSSGITFYTNLGSRQAGEISSNPHVSLHFNWAPLMRSVRISGTARQLSAEQALHQFHRYPRHVQLCLAYGPQASQAPTSRISGALQWLAERMGSLFGQQHLDIPMPANWGGFLLTPCLYEFGMDKGGPNGRTCMRFRRCLTMPRGARDKNINGERHDWVYDSCVEHDS